MNLTRHKTASLLSYGLLLFIFGLAESDTLLLLHRKPHVFSFPSLLSPYWLLFLVFLPGFAAWMALRSLSGIPESELSSTRKSNVANWIFGSVMTAYVLFTWTINTVQVMDTHW